MEITAVNQFFLDTQKLQIETLATSCTWLDTGTHESLLQASQFIETIEKRQGLKVGCLEEVAFQKGYITKDQNYLVISAANATSGNNLYIKNITKDQLLNQAILFQGTSYGEYLLGRYTP